MRVFQWLVFVALIAVSAFFTINLAMGLGTTPIEKAALVAGSVALEGLKAYALISANTASHRRSWGKALGLYGAYAFVAVYSLSACLGYSLAATDRMGASVAVLDHVDGIAAERAAVADCDQQITALRALVSQRQAALGHLEQPIQIALARRAITEGLGRIDGYLVRKDAASARIEAWRGQDHAASATARRSLYDVIGQALGVPAQRVAFAILAIFSLAIELGIFLSSPHARGAASAIEGKPARIRRSLPDFAAALLGAIGIGAALPRPAQARVRDRQPCRSPSAALVAEGGRS